MRITLMVMASVLMTMATGATVEATAPPPWARTEAREACVDFGPLRAPFFGETHVHTKYSADALVGDIRTGPRDAYSFAKGGPIGLPPYDAAGNAMRTAQLRRSLDFTVVTDHAEHFGEINICLTPGLPGYDASECQVLRDGIGNAVPLPPPLQPPAILAFFTPYVAAPNPVRFDFCGPGGADCLAQASLVWNATRNAAEEFYDRTSACTFTTFVGYEWTGSTLARNLHRNVIFRNDEVPALPITYIEQPTAQGLWAELRNQCLDAAGACDVLAIPHNSNVSLGYMFVPENADGSPITAQDAAFRAAMEPVVEITQHKGDSECRPGVLTNDELCGFEKLNRTSLAGISDPKQTFQPSAFVRNVLKDGLAQEEAIGVNPFRLGFLGGTDSHNSTPGLVREDDYGGAGHLGTRDGTPEFVLTPYPLGGIEANPGGLAVAWAEENSRDAIFAALRRREIYGTSGTRPIVRFFAGRFSGSLCSDPNFVEMGYTNGVPMGAEIGPVRRGRSPQFATLAFKDPGIPGDPGTPLQRIQIIKGWIDSNGQAQEKVFDVAGDPANGASVDLNTCVRSGPGFDSLCAVWEDPEFDASQRAFYYARVLENPSCRWSTMLCNSLGVDCGNPGSVPPEYDTCCDPLTPKTIQERAWASPIWYRPEGVSRLQARVRFGRTPGTDVLKLVARLGKVPAELDVNTRDLTVMITDDDEIYRVTIPAGTMQERIAGRKFVLSNPAGSPDGIKRASLSFTRRGDARLRLATVRMDLSNADRSGHQVDVQIQAGTYRAAHSRFWQAKGNRLLSP